MGFIDYAELKTRVSIEDAVQKLGIALRKNGTQLRGFCPACLAGGDRALAVTPAKSLFFCFNAKTGGDQLALVAHIKGMATNEAANWLAGTVPLARQQQNKTGALTTSPAPSTKAVFDPAAYADRLDPGHGTLTAIAGIDTLKSWKAGYAATGKLRGRLALPLCDRSGAVKCYVGIALKGEQPRLLYGAADFDGSGYLFGWDKITPGDILYVAKDPLDVLRAHEGGLAAVSFLGDATSTGLQVLSLLMDELQIPTVEFI